MARKSKKTVETTDFRHGSAKRTNIPPAKIAGEGKVPDIGKQKYAYSPHLSPVLQFDPEGRADKVREIVEKACAGKSLTAEEQEILRAVGANWENPSLEWAGKKEEHDRHWRTVDPVALHIHERVSANAILSVAKRKDAERTLFADPELEYREAVQFYKHDMDWANRLILGDSLEVMSSLSRREGLSGGVQVVYMDPPYGISFASNFQSELNKKDVKGKDEDLTREPEMIRAYRDTWSLGSHSYLSYLRDRLICASELLGDAGSIFIQISDENLHRVRALLDEVFGADNFVSQISFKTKMALGTKLLANVYDHLLWYAKDRRQMKYNPVFEPKELGVGTLFADIELPSGAARKLRDSDFDQDGRLVTEGRVFRVIDLNSSGRTPSCVFDVPYRGGTRKPTAGRSWKTNPVGMKRLLAVDRIAGQGKGLGYKLYHDDYPYMATVNVWTRTRAASHRLYAVQTAKNIIKRCVLMASDPGDLVLDPTSGSGTTADVAEEWGRRWIAIDSSRVALSIARQRVLTSTYDLYAVKGAADQREDLDPSKGFVFKTAPHVTLGSIAQNEHLDPIIAHYDPSLSSCLDRANRALADVTSSTREVLIKRLGAKIQEEGTRAVSDADRRRWLLPGTSMEMMASAWAGLSRVSTRTVQNMFASVPPGQSFEHWNIPFDADSAWPAALAESVNEYRIVWGKRTEAINACVDSNSEQEVLVDQPEVVSGSIRVAGPFTVEGVIPDELNLGADGLLEGAQFAEPDCGDLNGERVVEMQNLHAYLSGMVGHLDRDGVTFPDNKNPKFARLESLFDSDSASALHAEGVWEGDDADGPARVGVGFGPQYGPVTAKQVEELIRESSRRGYDELVVAGFSFDAEAHAIIHEDPNPKVRVHMAQIRPDLNAGMDGLLKDTPNSQLFTVFGSPAIEVARDGEEYTVTLEGVDIYDPVKNTVRSTKATKVAAWFLDSDYDGRTFCITQAFFPDQDAWGKLAKALKDVIEPETFAAFKGTTSLPFHAGEHKQIAVKVIDPRGSEVMTIHKLEG